MPSGLITAAHAWQSKTGRGIEIERADRA